MNERTAPRPRRPSPRRAPRPLPRAPRDVIIALLIIASRLEDALTNRPGQNIQSGFLLNSPANWRSRLPPRASPALCADAVYRPAPIAHWLDH